MTHQPKLHYSSRKYRQLVEWIAENDNPVDDEVSAIAGYLTVTMLAHCYNLKRQAVAEDVVSLRKQATEAYQQARKAGAP